MLGDGETRQLDALRELALHAQALNEAIPHNPKFFASVAHYVRRLHAMTGEEVAALSQKDLHTVVLGIEHFFAQWRADELSGYIPPREASDADPVAKAIVHLALVLVRLPRAEFDACVSKYAGRESVASHSSRAVTRLAGDVGGGGGSSSWSHLHARVRKHWLWALSSLLIAAVGITWSVATQTQVAPRDFLIAQLRTELEDLRARSASLPAQAGAEVLSETGVLEGSAATTSDGACTVAVHAARGEVAEVEWSVTGDSTRHSAQVRAGSRVFISGRTHHYVLTVHSLRGNIVDLSIFRDDQ